MGMNDREKAERFAEALFCPTGFLHPDKEQVFQFLEEQAEFDRTEFETWERVDFECRNGENVICGEYYPVERARGCAILVHGFAQNRYILIPQQKLFRELGFCTVLFDQRGFGVSREKYCTFGIREAKDVACLADHVRKRCGEEAKIVVLGVSMGAASAMQALKYTDNIDYLIEDCGFADIKDTVDSLYQSMNEGEKNSLAENAVMKKGAQIGIDMRTDRPIEAVEKSEIPICIFHGTADSTIGVEHAERLYRACRNPRSRMELFAGKEHALCVTDAKRYRDVLREFIR